MKIGEINKLKVISENESGYYLGDESSTEEAFLPPALCAEGVLVGDEINAFLYLDAKGALIATTVTPYAVVGEFAFLKAISVQEFGAFFDFGIDKDLLVPGNEQKHNVEEQEYHIVRVCLEEGTDRVFGTTKLGKYIENTEFDIFHGDEVSIQPVLRTELGFRCIINKKYIGMIYHNEIFKNITIGEKYDGVVKSLREDGLVDAALQIQGIKNLDASCVKILEELKKKGGELNLYDKSSPEDIKRVLSMSKKTFKNSVGMLYKRRKILIDKENKKIILVKK